MSYIGGNLGIDFCEVICLEGFISLLAVGGLVFIIPEQKALSDWTSLNYQPMEALLLDNCFELTLPGLENLHE